MAAEHNHLEIVNFLIKMGQILMLWIIETGLLYIVQLMMVT
ncbi:MULTISPECIES: hypothetical protein [unclassified Wolbachia]|nr:MULTISPECIES: hypothetical protein [unclassified Wolbachia]